MAVDKPYFPDVDFGCSTERHSSRKVDPVTVLAIFKKFKNSFLGAYPNDEVANTTSASEKVNLAEGLLYWNTTSKKFRTYTIVASVGSWIDYDSTAQEAKVAAIAKALEALNSANASAASAASAAADQEQTELDRIAAATSSTSAAADAAQVAADRAVVENAQALTNAATLIATYGQAVYPYAYASALPNGVLSIAIGGTAVSGAVVGIYALTPSGGSISGTVASLVVTSPTTAYVDVINPGLGSGTTPPTFAKPSGANLPSGTTLTATIGALIAVTKTYWAATSDGNGLALWQNGGSAPVAVNDPTSQQIVIGTKAWSDAIRQQSQIAVPSLLRSSLLAAPGAFGGASTTVTADTGTHTAVSGEVALGGAAATVGAAIPNNGRYTYISGAWLRTADLDSQTATAVIGNVTKVTRGFALLPTIIVDGRPVQPSLMSYDRRIAAGKYLDDGTPYEPLGPSAQVKPAVNLARRYIYLGPIIFNGRPLLPFAMSYDRRVPYGQYLDTGEMYTDGITGGSTADRTLMRVNQTPSGLSIFMAGAKSRWVEHVFMHETGTASGGAYDIWHLKGAWDTALTGFSPSRQQQLLRSDAEVETAIWTTAAGAGNFVGGSVHGAQVQSLVVMLVDGKITTMSQTASYTARRIEIIQQSALYAYGSSNVTKIADLYTRWVFENGDIRIGEAVQWGATPPQLQQAYISGILAVFRAQGSGPSGAGSPIEIVTVGRRSPLWLPEDLSTSGYAQANNTSEEMLGYGAGGYEFRLKKTRGWTYPNRASYYAPTVQNKFYQNIYGANYTPDPNQLDWIESVISIYNPY